MKLLVVGNSHTAALKASHDGEAAVAGGASVDFFAVPGRMQPQLQGNNGRLAQRTFGRSSVRTTLEGGDGYSFCPSEFDVIVFSALGVLPPTNDFINGVGGKNPIGFARLDSWRISPKYDAIKAISSAHFIELITDFISSSDTFRSLMLLRHVYDGPLLVEASPPPCVSMLEDLTWLPHGMYGDRVVDVWAEYYGLLNLALTSCLAAIGSSNSPTVRVGGLSASGFLDLKYKRGSDPWHANALYGSELWRDVLKCLG